MKKKIFSLLALFMAAMTASAFSLTKATGAEAHGTVVFKVNGTEVTTADEGQTVTVVITPNDGWAVNRPTGQWYAAVAKTPRRAPADNPGLLNAFELTKLLGQDNTWSFVMERANAEISVSYKKQLSNADVTIESIPDQTYTGQAIEPVLTVKDGSSVLVKGTDYDVVYMDNVKACLSTATQNAPTAIITAVSTSEKYAGGNSKAFTINKAPLTVTADDKSIYYSEAAPEFTVSYDGFVNSETEDVLGGTLAFACAYQQDDEAGTYPVTPSGLTSGNYAITFVAGTLTVKPQLMEEGMIAPIGTMIYNGKAHTPAPIVTFNGTVLKAGTDYSVSYENNTDAGEAIVHVTGLATSNFSGTASKNFSINRKELTVTADDKTIGYGDAAPTFTATYDGFVEGETKAVLGGTLEFECDYQQGSEAGTYAITPGGLTSTNYNFIFTPGTLMVTPATLTLDEEDDNTEALGDADGRQRDVTLKRTLQAGGWNTLALPFALSANQIAAVFGSGAKVKAFTGSSLSGSTLTLDFADAQAIEAGKPYLVKVSEDVDLSTQSIEGVTVSAEAVAVESASVDFIPTLGSTTITGSNTKSVLFLAAGNNLLNPTSLPADIKGFRAYFQLKGAAAAARAFSLNLGDGEPLSISPVGERTDAFTLNGNGIRYTLDGRKVNGQPKNGVYIQNGRKVVK